MLVRVLNAPLVFYGIAILRITFLEDLFVLNCRLSVQNITAITLLQLFEDFSCFSRISTFQNSWRLLQTSPEIIVMSLLSLLIFFLKICLHHKLCTCFLAFFDEKLSHDLEITKNVDFKIMLVVYNLGEMKHFAPCDMFLSGGIETF